MRPISELKGNETVVVLAKSEGVFRAVEVRAKGEELEWLRMESGREGDSWLSFARQCQVVTVGSNAAKPASKTKVALCLEMMGVAFYEFAIPTVGPEETEAVVRMQAETRLPLPIDQMDIAWRSRPGKAGETAITLAAARRGLLQGLSDQLMQIDPGQMVLEAEAVVGLWRHLAAHRAGDPILVDVTARRTLVCNVVEGGLAHATVMDVGWMDWQQTLEPAGAQDAALPTDVLTPFELFVRDLEGTLRAYGWTEGDRPLQLLTDSSELATRLAGALKAKGLAVVSFEWDRARLILPSDAPDGEAVYTYRLALGAGLCCLDGELTPLGLFERFCAGPKEHQQRRPALTPGSAAAVALLAVALMLAGLYGMDVVKAQRLKEWTQRAELEQVLKEQAFRRQIAQRRLSFPALLEEMCAAEGSGIVLDSFHFKEGQAIRVAGRADQQEQLHAFQEGLLAQKGIDKVDLTQASFNKKTKKFEFTLTFHYKKLTLRGATS